MSLFEIEASHMAIDVAFAQDGSKMVVLHHGGVDLYQWQIKNGRAVMPRLAAKYAFTAEEAAGSPLLAGFAHDGQLRTLSFQDGLYLHSVKLAEDASKLTIDGSILLAEEVIFPQAISVTSTSELLSLGDACLHSRSGRISRLPAGTDSPQPLPAGFPLQLPWVEIVEIENEVVAFGMSRNGHLYANSRLLVKNCTSFVVTCDHLIFTTSNHFLKFVHLSKPEGEFSSAEMNHTK